MTYLPPPSFLEWNQVSAIILSLISKNSNRTAMYSELSTIKLKAQRPANSGSHLATYQGEVIRKSICNDPSKKDKHSQRVVTETSEKCHSIGSEMKKMIKQFRAPFKSNSPNMKKKAHHDNRSNNPKTAPYNPLPQPKKKNSAQTKPQIINKNLTETGPLIKKKRPADKNEKLEKTDKHERLERTEKGDKIQKTEKLSYLREEKPKRQERDKERQKEKEKEKGRKKLGECRSAEQLARERQKGGKDSETFDCTPKNLCESDLQLVSLIGQGTFGKVYRARVKRTGQVVAVKRVFQDPKYKNREVEIVSMLQGEFTMRVLGTFSTEEAGSQYLNIVMEYYESDLYSHIRGARRPLTTFEIKLFSYQAFRGLLYIHSLSICHRDIKPHNLLVKAGRLVVCDFGSAKILTSEPNLPYICSRCYRAPELIFGASHYSTMIDVWSLGCVLLQMLHGAPLWVGDSSIDHLIEVIKVLGTPTKTQVIDMNPEYDLNDYKFPKVKRRDWSQLFPKADSLLLDLIGQLMIYSPKQRLNAAEALAHEFYDELREQKVGRAIQKQLNVGLFDFSYGQIRGNEHLLPKLIPSWVKFY